MTFVPRIAGTAAFAAFSLASSASPAQPQPHCCAAITISGSESDALPPAPRDFRVWVEPTSTIYGWRITYPAAVREAFAQWEDVGLPVTFHFVTDSSEANLFVHWRRRLQPMIRGRSTWWTMGDGIGYVRGEIEIAVGGADGHGLDHGLVRGIALHEIGHLLGLPHVNDSWSVMARTVRSSQLSRRDIAAARALYLPIAGTH